MLKTPAQRAATIHQDLCVGNRPNPINIEHAHANGRHGPQTHVNAHRRAIRQCRRRCRHSVVRFRHRLHGERPKRQVIESVGAGAVAVGVAVLTAVDVEQSHLHRHRSAARRRGPPGDGASPNHNVGVDGLAGHDRDRHRPEDRTVTGLHRLNARQETRQRKRSIRGRQDHRVAEVRRAEHPDQRLGHTAAGDDASDQAGVAEHDVARCSGFACGKTARDDRRGHERDRIGADQREVVHDHAGHAELTVGVSSHLPRRGDDERIAGVRRGEGHRRSRRRGDAVAREGPPTHDAGAGNRRQQARSVRRHGPVDDLSPLVRTESGDRLGRQLNEALCRRDGAGLPRLLHDEVHQHHGLARWHDDAIPANNQAVAPGRWQRGQ